MLVREAGSFSFADDGRSPYQIALRRGIVMVQGEPVMLRGKP